MPMLDATTTLGRLRIRSGPADASALQVRASSAIGALDLQPPAMPPQSILCIRTLRDPLPNGLDLRFGHAPRAAEWERAARGATARAFARAVRPSRGDVPADADAVLFSDAADLLACAAMAALRGSLGREWWWRYLLVEPTARAVAREWTAAPHYVPAAASILHDYRVLVPFIRTLGRAHAMAIAMATLQAHGLDSLRVELFPAIAGRDGASHSTALEKTEVRATTPAAEQTHAIRGSDAIRSTVDPLLQVEEQILVTIALLLRREPMLLRCVTAGEIVAAIADAKLAAAASATQVAPVVTRNEPVEGSLSTDPASTAPALPGAAARRAMAAGHDHVSRDARGEIAIGAVSSVPPDRPPSAERNGPTPPGAIASDPRPESSSPSLRPPAPGRSAEPRPAPLRSVALCTNEVTTDDAAVHTSFAGLFFLVNVATDLGLYGDFTSPMQRTIDLPVWDFLALTGRALCDEVEDDTIWSLLASLAGRDEETPPGRGFVPPDGITLDRWVENMAGRVRDRIREAIPDGSSTETDLLLRQPGTIRTTPVHVDVHFALASHPVEIRIAGLDRDPGWIPAAGRHVRFHFD